MTDYKLCGHCRNWLPAPLFGVDKSKPLGLAGRCRECRRMEHMRRRERSKAESARGHQRRRAEAWRKRAQAAERKLKALEASRLHLLGVTAGPRSAPQVAL